MASSLHPTNFQANEAWIAFQLNDIPIRTEEDGTFNCFSLMDAASCYLLGAELVSTSNIQPSQAQARNMLQMAWREKGQLPEKLLLPSGHFADGMTTEAKRLGIQVVVVPEHYLLVFIGEARDGYSNFLRGKSKRDA